MKLIVSLTSFILIIALQTSQIRSFSVPAVRNSYEPIRLNDSDPRYRRDIGSWLSKAWTDTKDWTVEAAKNTKDWTVEAAKNTDDFVTDFAKDDDERETILLPTNPNWMGNRRKTLGHLKMREVFLPGTHNSAAYKIEPSPFLHSLSEAEKIYRTVIDAPFGGVVSRFSLVPSKSIIKESIEENSLTQDLSVYNQLLHGARYLDIRVGRYPEYDDVFWCTHGPIRLVSLKTVIMDVKDFLKIYKDEIIIFDVQEFVEGFETIESHYQLIDFLEREFADYLLRRPDNGWSITLDEIWNSNKRVIIGYDDDRVLFFRTSVWQAVRHQWGDVRTLGSLYNHLNKIETQAAEDENPSPRPRAAMAELTGNIETIAQMRNIRTMSTEANLLIAKWYGEKWPHTANIVAVDFIENSGIVVTAIEWNDRRVAGY